jgi:hypothetical protein
MHGSEVKAKRIEVKRSEAVYIQGRGKSDCVATSYRLDSPGSFPGSILVFSLFFRISSVFSCVCFFLYYVFVHVFSVFFLYFLFLMFSNVHDLVLYVCICTVDVHVLCLCKHCHRAEAQLWLIINKYINILHK